MYTVASLYAGSSGNALLARFGDTAILIDEGGSTRRTERALASVGLRLTDIAAIFVTHEHTDHTAGLSLTARKYAVQIFLPRMCLPLLPDLSSAHPFSLPFERAVGQFRVIAFATPHDAVASVGYLIESPAGRLGIATDMGFVSREVVDALAGCDAAVIEANYDEEMLLTGSYPPALRERILSHGGHLSNEDAGTLAAALAASGARDILLTHLSRENNTPSRALSAVQTKLDERNLSSRLVVADRDNVTFLLQCS